MPYNILTDKEIAQQAYTLISKDLSRAYSLYGIVSECGVTVFALKRIIKTIYKEFITQFSLRIRMEKAKELHATTNNTIQMIAEAVGYTEGNNFHANFRQCKGKTPGQYRKNCQNS